MSRLAGLVLAAGRSKRFGGDSKLLAELGGCALVAHAVRAALAADLSPVVVVVGREFEAVANAVARDAPGVVAFVRTPDGHEDLSDSLKSGLASLSDVGGAFVFLADMPFVTAALVRQIRAVWEQEHAGQDALAAAPRHDGRRGHPVLLAAAGFSLTDALRGDKGLGAILTRLGSRMRLVDVDSDDCLIDIDTRADLDSARVKWRDAAEGRASSRRD